MLYPKILRRLSKSFFENPLLLLKYFVDFSSKEAKFSRHCVRETFVRANIAPA